MKSMLFHTPWPVDPAGKSATSIRPQKILAAFRTLGYRVDVVSGTAEERWRTLQEVRAKLAAGHRYSFLYSESSTLPTPFASGKDDFFRHPFIDYQLFAMCKSFGIPIGLFYRDIYWRFGELGGVSPRLRAAAFQVGYWIDLLVYRRFIQILFLPSTRMSSYVPGAKHFTCVELPSGTEAVEEDHAAETDLSRQPLRLVYVGGIGDHYRMHELFRAVAILPDAVELVVCCREVEWQQVAALYGPLSANISVVHQFGREADELVKSADLCSLFVEPNAYRDFAMPMKLFTYLGAHKPIVATKDTAAGDFVERQKIGWAVPYEASTLAELLRGISRDRRVVEVMRREMAVVALRNTWVERVREVERSFAPFSTTSAVGGDP